MFTLCEPKVFLILHNLLTFTFPSIIWIDKLGVKEFFSSFVWIDLLSKGWVLFFIFFTSHGCPWQMTRVLLQYKTIKMRKIFLLLFLLVGLSHSPHQGTLPPTPLRCTPRHPPPPTCASRPSSPPSSGIQYPWTPPRLAWYPLVGMRLPPSSMSGSRSSGSTSMPTSLKGWALTR